MPPKKVVDTSKAATGDEAALAKEQLVRDGVSIDDFTLPKSIVTRLAKGVLPPNTQIQGNAMLAMTKSATVFVNYLASSANDHAQSQGRKTLGTADVFAALDQLEFPDWKERLEGELAKYHSIAADKRNKAKKNAADKAADADDTKAPEDGQPASKKARLDDEAMEGHDESVLERSEAVEHSAEEEGGSPEDEDGTESEEDDGEGEERPEVEEQLEDTQAVEEEDEALDNGEDSD